MQNQIEIILNDMSDYLNVTQMKQLQESLVKRLEYEINEEEAYGKYKHFLCDEGDLIIASSGIKVDYFDKKMGFVKPEHLPLCMNTSTIRFKSLDREVLDINYFMYFLKSQAFKKQLARQITGSAQLNFGPSHLSKMSFSLIDMEDQINIVKQLGKIELIIEMKTKQIQEYDQLIKSRFVEMFTDINLNVKKDNWIKLGKITEIVTGTTPSTNDETNWDGKYLWITPAELNDDSFYVYDTNRKITDKGLASKSLRIMPVDTVLLSTRAPIGNTAIVGNPITCNLGFKYFICSDNENQIYLFSLLKFNKDYLNSIGTGTTFKEISKTTISNVEIPVPSINLQNEFAKFVQQIDKLKFVYINYIIELCIYLYSKLLNGGKL